MDVEWRLNGYQMDIVWILNRFWIVVEWLFTFRSQLFCGSLAAVIVRPSRAGYSPPGYPDYPVNPAKSGRVWDASGRV